VFADAGDLKAGILVLPPGAAEQAPKTIDDFTVQSVLADGTPVENSALLSQPMGQRYFRFYEAVAAIVRGDLSGVSPNDREREKFLNVGISAASRFIQFCKVFSKDELVFFNVPPVSAPNFHLDGFPYSENWFDASSNQKLEVPNLNSTYSQWIGLRHGMTPVPWQRVSAAYQSQNQPPIDVLLLLESCSAYVNADDRKAVLFAAMAAEISALVLVEHKLPDKKLRQQLDTMDLPVWEKLFDAFPKVMGLASLKNSDPVLFGELSRLFRARNKIAHEGLCYIDKDDSQQPKLLTRSQVWELINAAEKAIDWTRTL